MQIACKGRAIAREAKGFVLQSSIRQKTNNRVQMAHEHHQASSESSSLVEAAHGTGSCLLAHSRVLQLNSTCCHPPHGPPSNEQHDGGGPNRCGMTAHVQECVDDVASCLVEVIHSGSIRHKEQHGEYEGKAKELDQVLYSTMSLYIGDVTII